MRREAILMSIFSILLSLFECGKKAHINTFFPSPVPLPAGETLTGLHMTRQGMRSGLCYVMSVEGEDIFLKMTNCHPLEKEYRFNAKEILSKNEKCAIKSTNDIQVLRDIEEALVDCGTVGWDGFNETIIMKNVTDTGERYEIYLRFSGGSTVSVYGIDICPDRFNEVFNRIAAIFRRTVKWE